MLQPPPSLQLPDTEARARFLCSPAAFGGRSPVQCIETHMSWVALCGDEVLKLKKPVRQSFLDFSTVEAREHNVREELRLNRRLAPSVYRGVKALQWHDDALSIVDERDLPAPGTTIDWLVHMRRLPAEQMLDTRLRNGRLAPAKIEELADTLSRFYLAAARAGVNGDELLRRQRREHELNRVVLLDDRFALGEPARGALQRFEDALARCAPLLRERAPHVVDGHGDLRPEHVCLSRPPLVIDCVEFNAALRQVDPFDELAFLGMECALQGQAWIGQAMWQHCARQLGHAPPPAVRHLYTASRSLLRARLMAAHLLDLRPRTPEQWLPRCRRYLAQAMLALQRFQEA